MTVRPSFTRGFLIALALSLAVWAVVIELFRLYLHRP